MYHFLKADKNRFNRRFIVTVAESRHYHCEGSEQSANFYRVAPCLTVKGESIISREETRCNAERIQYTEPS